MRQRGRSVAALTVAIVLAMFAVMPFAGQASAQDATPEPSGLAAAGLQELAITAQDSVYSVTYATQPFVLEGWTLLNLTNETKSLATVSFVLLPEEQNAGDLSSAIFDAFQGEGGELPEWWSDATFAGGAYAAAGESGQSAVYLTPGTWALYSSNPASAQSVQTITVLTAQEALDNYGVESEATPVPDAGATPVVEGLDSTGQLSIEDGEFVTESEPEVGENIWEVTNNNEQVADVVLVRVEDTVDDAAAAELGASFAAGELPADATLVGGTGGLSTGETAYVQAQLESGTYVAFSTQPDADGGVQASNGLVLVVEVK